MSPALEDLDLLELPHADFESLLLDSKEPVYHISAQLMSFSGHASAYCSRLVRFVVEDYMSRVEQFEAHWLKFRHFFEWRSIPVARMLGTELPANMAGWKG